MSYPSEQSYQSYRELMPLMDSGKILVIHMPGYGNYLLWLVRHSNLIASLKFDDIGQGWYEESMGSIDLCKDVEFSPEQAVTIQATFRSKIGAIRAIRPLFSGVGVGSQHYFRILHTPYASQKAVAA